MVRGVHLGVHLGVRQEGCRVEGSGEAGHQGGEALLGGVPVGLQGLAVPRFLEGRQQPEGRRQSC